MVNLVVRVRSWGKAVSSQNFVAPRRAHRTAMFAAMLASIVVSLGDEYLQRRGFIETRPRQH